MQERKTPAQKKVLYQLKADAIAHVLADVEAINLRGGANQGPSTQRGARRGARRGAAPRAGAALDL